MKNLVIIFTLFLLLFSCSEDDLLERYPTTSTVIENYYSTPEDGKQALTAVYNMLLRDDYWSPIIFSEIASDVCAGGAGSGDGGSFQRVDRALQWPEASAHQDAWKTYFGGIARANIYIENEALIDWVGHETEQKQYLAEARYLRAYFHFLLARFFGPIPIIDKIVANEVPSRSTPEDLYTFMLDDLQYCAENGISKPYASIDVNDWGRATQWSAKAMYARVYLFYSGYYNSPSLGEHTVEKARGHIDDIVNDGGFSMATQFASLWRVPAISELSSDTSLTYYAGEINPEVVWSIRYVPSEGYGGNLWQRMIGPRGTNHDPYGTGWGAMTVRPDYWESFLEGDTRKTATVLSVDDTPGFTYDYVGNAQAQYTGYSMKKYEIVSFGDSPEPEPNWQTDAFEDFIVLRYADVLLMGAELHLNGGNSGTAVNYFNQVRSRAFGDDSHNLSSVTLDDIVNERRWELAGEGVWYYDILRSLKGDFSKLAEILTYEDNTDGGDYSQTADVTSLDVDGNNFVATRGLFQIPQSEIDLMEGIIEQNPGYE